LKDYVPLNIVPTCMQHWHVVFYASTFVAICVILLLERLYRCFTAAPESELELEPEPEPTMKSASDGEVFPFQTPREVSPFRQLRSVTASPAKYSDDWESQVMDMTMSELRAELKSRSLSVFGSEMQLRERLLAAEGTVVTTVTEPRVRGSATRTTTRTSRSNNGGDSATKVSVASAKVTVTSASSTRRRAQPVVAQPVVVEVEEEDEEVSFGQPENTLSESAVRKLALPEMRQILKGRGENCFGAKEVLITRILGSPSKRKRNGESPQSGKRAKTTPVSAARKRGR